ncbi:salicylate hydroxylase [Hypoxylon fuscum]|nr:salicylate hydroxylase [Hypoxylon fuscum]
MDNKLRVAVIVGGLARATLANALARVPKVDVHVFESAPEFSERGAAVELSKNAQLALAQILPSGMDILEKAGAVPMNSTRNILGSGPEAGTITFDLAAEDPTIVVHRASLLRELLAPLPKETLHPNKKLTAINPNESGVEITFYDDTVYQFDAVIGTDAGEHSVSLAGLWDCRNVVPFEKAKVILGEKYFDVDRQYGWVGDGAFLLHDVLENRTMVQCIIAVVEKDTSKGRDRKRPLTREILTKSLSNCLGGPIADGMISEHKSTPTYARERVSLLGDAAHTTTPWQGTGAGLAIEDAMVLGTLFANISSLNEIGAAFKAYDILRRPRCQRVIDSSRETGQILSGQIDLRADKIRELLAPKWDFIFGLDMESHKQEALDEFRKMQQK